jgi:hypothetical protein
VCAAEGKVAESLDGAPVELNNVEGAIRWRHSMIASRISADKTFESSTAAAGVMSKSTQSRFTRATMIFLSMLFVAISTSSVREIAA